MNNKVDIALVDEYFHYSGDITIENNIVNITGRCIVKGSKQVITSHLPFKFGKIGTYLSIGNMGLVSLDGCPDHVQRIGCDRNNLTSLIGCTTKLTSISISNNPLTSLDGLPELTEYIILTLTKNLPILRLILIPSNVNLDIANFKHEYKFNGEHLKNIIEDNRQLIDQGDNRKSIILKCQKELIENGFIGNARW